jgi:hypothetical protein
VLQSLLGLSKALGRTLILPKMLCYCDFLWKEMRACRVGGAESMRLPFDCPMDHVLDTPKWFEDIKGFGVADFRQSGFLAHPRVPANVSGGVVRVSLPKGVTDAQARALLADHSDAPVLELAEAAGIFCGFEDDSMGRAYAAASRHLLHYRRLPLCYEEGAGRVPGYSQCCTPRKPGDAFWPCVHGFDPPEDLPKCVPAASGSHGT